MQVHNIGGETRGEVWEHIITLIRCPFLALSATVQNPETLHFWLQVKHKNNNTDESIDNDELFCSKQSSTSKGETNRMQSRRTETTKFGWFLVRDGLRDMQTSRSLSSNPTPLLVAACSRFTQSLL